MEPRRKPRKTRQPAGQPAGQSAGQPDRRLGVTLLSAGAAALGLGATLVAALLLGRRSAPAPGHPAPDLAPDAPAPGPDSRAPEHFRPDPTAVPTAEEREALRPATGPAPSLAADRGAIVTDKQDAA